MAPPVAVACQIWWGQDLNLRPLGYEGNSGTAWNQAVRLGPRCLNEF
jgi:hypothetical protein